MTTATANRLRDIRDRVMQMEGTDCRQELADTLEVIDQLEHDFSVLCIEVATLSYNRSREAYDTSRDFDKMTDRRGIEYPWPENWTNYPGTDRGGPRRTVVDQKSSRVAVPTSRLLVPQGTPFGCDARVLPAAGRDSPVDLDRLTILC